MNVYIAQKGNGEYQGEVLAVATTSIVAITKGLELWRSEFDQDDILPEKNDIEIYKKELFGI